MLNAGTGDVKCRESYHRARTSKKRKRKGKSYSNLNERMTWGGEHEWLWKYGIVVDVA